MVSEQEGGLGAATATVRLVMTNASGMNFVLNMDAMVYSGREQILQAINIGRRRISVNASKSRIQWLHNILPSLLLENVQHICAQELIAIRRALVDPHGVNVVRGVIDTAFPDSPDTKSSISNTPVISSTTTYR